MATVSEVGSALYGNFRAPEGTASVTDLLEMTREALVDSRIAVSGAVDGNTAMFISAINPLDAVLLQLSPRLLKLKIKSLNDARVVMKQGMLAVSEELKGSTLSEMPNSFGAFAGIIGASFITAQEARLAL